MTHRARNLHQQGARLGAKQRLAGAIGPAVALIVAACSPGTPPAPAGTPVARSAAGDTAPAPTIPPVTVATATTAPAAPATPTRQPGSLADAVARVKPSVVYIATENSIGSGVIYHPDGYLLTSNHVIDSDSQIAVTLGNGETWPARLLGRLANYDLAVLKIDATNLPAASFADARELREGEDVVAIGYALNLREGGPTVTNGIVSAKRQSTNGPLLVQTTVPLNPGNSGGPLVNLKGQVVGINAARVRRVEDIPVEGISLAVSANDALAYISGQVTAPAAPAAATVAATLPRSPTAAPAANAVPNVAIQVAPTAPLPPPTSTPVPPPMATPARAGQVAIAGYDIIPAPPGQPATLVGQVQNVGPGAIENVRIAIRFLDAGGRLIGTQIAAGDLLVVLPGERAPFAATLSGAAPGWASVQVEATASAASPETLNLVNRSLTTEAVRLQPPRAPGQTAVLTGLVRNAGAAPARSIRLAAVFYDASGKVIDVAAGVSDPTNLPPGVAGTFQLPLRRESGHTGYVLIAESDR